jgi:hypothetical protein
VLRLDDVDGSDLVVIEIGNSLADVLGRESAAEYVPALARLEDEPAWREGDRLGREGANVARQATRRPVVLPTACVVEAVTGERVNGRLLEDDQRLVQQG